MAERELMADHNLSPQAAAVLSQISDEPERVGAWGSLTFYVRDYLCTIAGVEEKRWSEYTDDERERLLTHARAVRIAAPHLGCLK